MSSIPVHLGANATDLEGARLTAAAHTLRSDTRFIVIEAEEGGLARAVAKPGPVSVEATFKRLSSKRSAPEPALNSATPGWSGAGRPNKRGRRLAGLRLAAEQRWGKDGTPCRPDPARARDGEAAREAMYHRPRNRRLDMAASTFDILDAT